MKTQKILNYGISLTILLIFNSCSSQKYVAGYRSGIEQVNNIDTTGAGDLYASGFIYGLCMDQTLDIAGRIGSILGGHITEVIGAKMHDESWITVKQKVGEVCCT